MTLNLLKHLCFDTPGAAKQVFYDTLSVKYAKTRRKARKNPGFQHVHKHRKNTMFLARRTEREPGRTFHPGNPSAAKLLFMPVLTIFYRKSRRFEHVKKQR